MPHSLRHLPSLAVAMTDLGRIVIVDDYPAQLRLFLTVLEATPGSKLKALSILGIDRSTLHRKLKQIRGAAALPLPS